MSSNRGMFCLLLVSHHSFSETCVYATHFEIMSWETSKNINPYSTTSEVMFEFFVSVKFILTKSMSEPSPRQATLSVGIPMLSNYSKCVSDRNCRID